MNSIRLPASHRFCFYIVILSCLPVAAFSGERDWLNTGTDFNAGSSWSANIAPGTGDVAWFKTAKVTDPTLTSSATIVGLYFGDKNGGTSSFGYHLNTSSSLNQLSLSGRASTTEGNEIANKNAPAIGADNTSGVNTIDAAIALTGGNAETQTIYQAAGGTLVMNGALSSAATVTLDLNGGGTLRLSGANSYTGETLISAGRLEANSNSALGTSGVTVNSGGTLVFVNFSATNRINNSAAVTLAGGTLARAGNGTVSEGSGATVVNGSVVSGSNVTGIGSLTLNGNSILDFGNDGGRGTLVFSSFIPNANVLNVLNWASFHANKATNTSGIDGTDDRLIFNQDQSSNLAAFHFGTGFSATEIALGGGYFEIVPVAESETWFAAALATITLSPSIDATPLNAKGADVG